MQVVKELNEVKIESALHQRRRGIVLLRDDGNYAVAEQYYYISKYEGEIVAEGWATLPSFGIYATATIAEAEGRVALARRWMLPSYPNSQCAEDDT